MAYGKTKGAQMGTVSKSGNKKRAVDGATTSRGVGRDARGCPTADFTKAGANVNRGRDVGNYHAGQKH